MVGFNYFFNKKVEGNIQKQGKLFVLYLSVLIISSRNFRYDMLYIKVGLDKDIAHIYARVGIF